MRIPNTNTHLYLIAGSVVIMASACGDELQVNLVVNNPCNQTVLPQADYITVVIEAEGLDTPASSTFTGDAKQGELGDIPTVDNATLTVLAKQTGTGGGPSTNALAAVSAAGLNLSGAGEANPLELSMAVGLVGQFARTTKSEAVCSSMTIDRRGHTATLLPDGRVFIVGGERVTAQNERSLLKSTEFYNPRTGSFERGPDLPGGARREHTATVLPSSKILIAGGTGLRQSGGVTAEDTLKSGLIFDPASDTFETSIVVLKSARAGHTATMLDDGTVVLAGGSYRSGTLVEYLATIEFYDTSAGTYTTTGVQLSIERGYHAAVALPDGSGVVFIGGRDDTQAHRSIDIYRNGGMSVGPQMSTARVHAQATVLVDHKLALISGGFDDIVDGPPYPAALDSMELFSLPDSSTPTGAISCGNTLLMAEGRAIHQAAKLPDGRVLVTGGIGSGGQPVAAAELITVQDVGTCSAPSQPTDAQMTIGRAFHAMSLLPGGDLLVSGGVAYSDSAGGQVSGDTAEYFVIPRVDQ